MSDGRPRCCLHMCACDGRVGEAESANRGSSWWGRCRCRWEVSCMLTTSTMRGLDHSLHTIVFSKSACKPTHLRSVSRRVTPTATCGLRRWVSSESKTKKKKKTKNRAPPRDARRGRKSRNQISKNNSKKNRFGASSAAFRLSANAGNAALHLLVARRGVAAAARAAGSTRAGPQCQAQTVA